VLLVALVVETILFVAAQGDYVVADPLWYASLAHSIAADPSSAFGHGEMHPFVMRVGLTLPLALLYRLFGVSTLVSNLPCLIAANGTIATVYAAARTPRAKVIGMALCLACVPLFQHMRLLGVDLPAGALIGCSVLCIARRDGRRGALWLAGGVVAWFAAFLVKEIALWCAPIWIYAIVVDLRASGWKATARTYAPAVGIGVVLGAGYLALCAVVWGDPLARIHGITHAVSNVQAARYSDAWLMPGAGASRWIARLIWQVPVLLVTMFGAMLVPVVLSPWLIRGRDRIWPVATAVIALCYWFGSSTIRAYLPLPISQRMIVPVLPCLLATAALAVDGAIDRWRLGIGARRAIVVAWAVVVVAQAALPIAAGVRHPHPETDAFALVRREAAADPARPLIVVCGEPRCAMIGNFYFGFAPPPNVTMPLAGEFAAAPPPHGAIVRALVNRIRAPGAHNTDPSSDRTADITALQLPILAGNKNVTLYDAGDGVRLHDALH
jgi:hypothetical protein